jgi:hypothetical protein
MIKTEQKTFGGWFALDDLRRKLDAELRDGWSIVYNSTEFQLDTGWKDDTGNKIPIFFFCVLSRTTNPLEDIVNENIE